MSKMISVENASFLYSSHDEGKPDKLAVDNVTLSIEKGEFLAVLGRNGSGKSTLARLMNALLLPTGGNVIINQINTLDEQLIWEIRRTAGMVFQNPDNQIVGTIVEEDVAFGPENIGVPPEEIRKRIDVAMETVGILEYSKHAPHLLSGGQKQRVAIAGILAMRPECIILDEATAMLDPVGRKEVMRVLRKLNEDEKITIVHITHHMDEAVQADRVVIMEKGAIVLSGKPSEVFRRVEQIKSLGLDVPQVTELIHELKKAGIGFDADVLTVEDAFDVLSKRLKGAPRGG